MTATGDIEGLEARAAAVLPADAMDYFRGGSDDELTLHDNVAAWRRHRLRPHVLRDVSTVRTATTLLGTPIAAPVIVAPTAYHLLAHPDGEAGTARAVEAAGSLLVLSTFATQSLEEVAAAAPSAARWFQVYVNPDRGWTAELALRAAAAGYTALVLTVDVPVLGRRRRDERNRFELPHPLIRAHDHVSEIEAGAAPFEGSAIAAHAARSTDASLTFDDIGWLRDVGGLPVVVKGVLRGDDATACLDAGARAVIVSNHGGRQLDGAVATADALTEVVDAVDGRAEVLVDGGIRGGSDVVKALALGARAVLVGRPVVYGLACDGWEGARDVLTAYADETARAMMLCGAASVADLTPDLVVGPG